MPQKRNRATKIIATVGPASNSPEKLKELFLAGVDVFRLNFSHGTQENHGEVLDRIRALEQDVGRPIGVIADLQGRSCASAASPKAPSPSPPARCCGSMRTWRPPAMTPGCRSPIPTSSKRW